MSAPYTVTVTVSNAAGEAMTVLTQHCKEYEELVAYQRAIADGIFGMAAQAVELRRGNKSPG